MISGSKSYLNELNSEQYQAVTSPLDEPLFIYAGAGSGKTRTLICRISYMIDQGIDPESILALSFTRKSADEIKDRLRAFIGPRAQGVTTATFHQLCLQILRANPFILNFPKPTFKIADAQAQRSIIKSGIQALFKITNDKKLRNATPQAIRLAVNKMLNFVRHAKAQLKTPNDFDNDNKFIYQFYQDQLKKHCLIDFQDFLTKTDILLKKYPRIAAAYRMQYKYILIDEFQDTSDLNFSIIKSIMGPSKQITVVGDMYQSIYSFRGANPKNIELFLQTFPNAKQISLSQNYRSTQTILDAAQSLISHAIETTSLSKPLKSLQKRGELVNLIIADDVLDEATRICKEIEKMVFPGSAIKYRDIVILFRVRKVSADIEMELFRSGIPYTFKRGTGFFKRKEVRDVLAYARLAMADFLKEPDPNNMLIAAVETVINVPERDISPKVLEKLKEALPSDQKVTFLDVIEEASNNKISGIGKPTAAKLADFMSTVHRLSRYLFKLTPDMATDLILTTIIDTTKMCDSDQAGEGIDGADGVESIDEQNDVFTDYIMDKRETLDLLVNEGKRFQAQLLSNINGTPMSSLSNLQKFLNNLALDGPSEASKNAVTLSTIHQMKGLESPVVFLMRFNDGFLPMTDSGDDSQTTVSIEEERRIAYVAMTRAKSKLFLTCSRTVKGKDCELSPFLSEIRGDCLTRTKQMSKEELDEIKELVAAAEEFTDDDF